MTIILLILDLILLILFVKWRYFGIAALNRYFSAYGVVVVGNRGKGKDVAFATYAHHREHYSNIEYNELSEVRPLTDLECGISPDELINDFYEPQEKVLRDNVPFIVSDGGVHFASWLDNLLKKNYTSVPVSVALWRQLYDSSLLFNTQVFSRLWLLIREQAEYVLMCRGVTHIGFGKKRGWLLCSVRFYERYQDAEMGLKPLRRPLIGGQHTKIENSTRGEIRDFRYLVPVKWLKYDSRDFHKKVFGYAAEADQKQRFKI